MGTWNSRPKNQGGGGLTWRSPLNICCMQGLAKPKDHQIWVAGAYTEMGTYTYTYMLRTDLKPLARFKAGQPDYKPAGRFQSRPRREGGLVHSLAWERQRCAQSARLYLDLVDAQPLASLQGSEGES